MMLITAAVAPITITTVRFGERSVTLRWSQNQRQAPSRSGTLDFVDAGALGSG
jgi:hypothetical protein